MTEASPETQTQPAPLRDRIFAWFAQVAAFARLLLDRFAMHQAPQNAAALTYTTLLSLVPLITVALAVLSAFPMAGRVSLAIQDFLFANFLPASGEVLRQHLLQFSAKASQLTGTGFAFLVLVALLLMRSVDRALNAIWEVRRRRSPLNQFVVYWAVLSLGPLLIGVSLLVTSYLVSLPLLSEAAASGVGRRLLGLAPVLASALAFTLTYALVPNRHVSLRHALAGGVFAAVLFEVAKHAFGWFVTQFPTYEAIYGVLAAIPVFLVWLYLSWVLVLLGAEFTHCLGIYGPRVGTVPGRRMGLVDAVQVLGLLGAARGRPQRLRRLTAAVPGASEHRLEDLLEDLHALQWVHRTDDGGWVLARSLDDLTLYDLVHSADFPLPEEQGPDWPVDLELAQTLQRARAGLAEVLQVPLARFAAARSEVVALSRRSA